MIQILETNVTMRMSLPEFRVLTKLLGIQSVHRLMDTDGLGPRYTRPAQRSSKTTSRGKT